MATQSLVPSVMLCLTASLLLMSVAQLSSGHEVKGQLVDTYVKAMNHLQPFLSARRFDQRQKCERIAVVLDDFERSSKRLTQFQVADIALLKKDEAAAKYIRQIKSDPDRSRVSFMNAIDQHIEQKQVGPSMIDLVECLKRPPFDVDSEARGFVKGEKLNKIVRQYKSIAEQPITLLTVDGAQHPELKLEQLDDTIKATVLGWLGGDEDRLASIFPSDWFRSESDGEDRILEEALVGTLIDVYEQLPQNTEFGDRCQVYRQVLAADERDLSRLEYPGELVQSLEQEYIDENDEVAPHPILDAEVTIDDRENFLWILHNLDFTDTDLEVWSDLDDCVAEWLISDPKIDEYLSDERRHELKEKLEEMPVDEGYENAFYQDQPYAGPQEAPVEYRPAAPAPVHRASIPVAAPAPAQGQAEVVPRVPSRVPFQGQVKQPARGPASGQKVRGNAPNYER